MTLIVTAINLHGAVQVADTRLTLPNGAVYDDSSAKTTIVHCRDAKFALSYTGLATLDSKRTDRWLVGRLRAAKASDKVLLNVIEILKSELSNALPRNPALSSVGLTLALAVLGVSPDGVRQGAYVLISNALNLVRSKAMFQNVAPRGRPFESHMHSVTESSPWLFSVDGAIDTQFPSSGLRKRVAKQLRTASEFEDFKGIMTNMVTVLRVQTRHPKLGGLIGLNCTAVIITSDFRGSAFSFPQTGTNPLRHYPNIVRIEQTVEAMHASSDGVFTAIITPSGLDADHQRPSKIPPR